MNSPIPHHRGRQAWLALLGLTCSPIGPASALPLTPIDLESSQPAGVEAGAAETSPDTLSDEAGPPISRADVAHMVAAEEWIVALTPFLKDMKADLMNLRMPGAAMSGYMREDFSAPPIGALLSDPGSPGDLADRRHWHAGEGDESSRAARDGWPLFETFDHVTRANIGVLSAIYDDHGVPSWKTKLKLVASGRATKSGESVVGLRAKVLMEWTWDSSVPWPKGTGGTTRYPSPKAGWKLARFETISFDLQEAQASFFEDDLEAFIRDDEERELLSRSGQDDILLRRLMNGESTPPDFIVAGSPGLSVVDINGDGFDDLFLTPRFRRSRLLQNTGDGRFFENAAEYGLELPGGCTSASFADFDNDGDLDLLVGRSNAGARYLIRSGDHYEDRTEELAGSLPQNVAAISVADFNGDGLLDAYFATYAAAPMVLQRNAMRSLSGEDVDESEAPDLFDLQGPQNSLVLNRGGGVLRVSTRPGAAHFGKHTLGVSASDFDFDGDQDLYCANDFAFDVLLVNDGSGRFEDASDRVRSPMGFGMGASWGDYDGDGRFDLYVSNMYSKAGTRISQRIPGLAAQIGDSATGNFLLRNTGSDFVLASDNLGEGHAVSKAGWSYGSQFLDVNNDSRLDIFAPNGYFTAPAAIAKDEDL